MWLEVSSDGSRDGRLCEVSENDRTVTVLTKCFDQVVDHLLILGQSISASHVGHQDDAIFIPKNSHSFLLQEMLLAGADSSPQPTGHSNNILLIILTKLQASITSGPVFMF